MLYFYDFFIVYFFFYVMYYGFVVCDFGYYVGVLNVIINYGNFLFGRVFLIGKRLKIEILFLKENLIILNNDNLIVVVFKWVFFEDYDNKVKNEFNEKVGKKNIVVVSCLLIIYYLFFEIYYWFIIVVYCFLIMIYCVFIFYY